MKFDAAFVQVNELIPGWIGGWKEGSTEKTEFWILGTKKSFVLPVPEFKDQRNFIGPLSWRACVCVGWEIDRLPMGGDRHTVSGGFPAIR
jgi:hypothetical protein